MITEKDFTEVFGKEYRDYIGQLQGIAMMAPSTHFGPRGLAGAHEEAAKNMIRKILKSLDVYSEGNPG